MAPTLDASAVEVGVEIGRKIRRAKVREKYVCMLECDTEVF